MKFEKTAMPAVNLGLYSNKFEPNYFNSYLILCPLPSKQILSTLMLMRVPQKSKRDCLFHQITEVFVLETPGETCKVFWFKLNKDS